MRSIGIAVVAALALGAWTSPVAAKEEDEDPALRLPVVDVPWWTLTTDWGGSALPLSAAGEGFDLRGVGGLTLTLRWPLGSAEPFAAASAFPVGRGVYSARAGVILGKRSERHYTELIGGRGRVVHYFMWRDQISVLSGLVAAMRVDHRDEETSPILEVGFAHSGQRQFQFLALYDPEAGVPGFKAEFVQLVGRGKLTYALRVGVELFLDLKTYPMPAMFTFGIGFGDGFDFYREPPEEEDESQYDY